MENLRFNLAPYYNQRVYVTGFTDTSNYFPSPHGSPNKVHLLQDVEVRSDDGQTHYVGHVWVQRANAIYDAKYQRGTLIGFWARVISYDDGRKHGLANPDQVEPLAAYQEPSDAFGLIHKTQSLKARLDTDALVPHLDDLFGLAEACGGKDKLKELLTAVKGAS